MAGRVLLGAFHPVPMKRNVPLAVLALLLASCAHIQIGNDPAVVNAERDTQLAADTFTLVVNTEKQARPTLVGIDYKSAIAIKHGVDYIRVNAPKWLSSARAVTKAYKENRNAENKANLQTAIATLMTGLTQAQGYLTQINQATQQKATP